MKFCLSYFLLFNETYYFGLLEFNVYVYKEIDLISCGGIEVRNLRASAIARKKPLGEPVLEKFQFVPHISVQVDTYMNHFLFSEVLNSLIFFFLM